MNSIDNKIKTILEDAIWAPSGDNSQPWKFRISGKKVDIFNQPDLDNPIMNVRQSGSLASHGAVIENIDISARKHGFGTKIELFPNDTDKNLVATITFEEGSSGDASLFESIRNRVTNRKKYKKESLDTNDTDQLIALRLDDQDIKLHLNQDKKSIKQIAKALARMEKIALENRGLHKLFFKDILWSKKENEEKIRGLYIKTLELPPPIQLAFRFLKHWSVTKIFNKIGFSNVASKGNEQTYVSSSGFALVTSKTVTEKDYVNVGRLFQRFWLTCTKLGVSVQPVTGVLFLIQRMRMNDIDQIEAKHIPLLERSEKELKEAFNLGEENMIMMFRFGHGKAPTARSIRLPLENFLIS